MSAGGGAPLGAVLRDLAPGDVDGLLRYINALIAEDTYIDAHGRPLNRTDEAAYVAQRRSEMSRGDAVARVATVDGRIVAMGELRRLGGRSRHVAELGVSVSDGYRDAGLGTHMVDDLCSAAGRLGVRRIVLRVFATNARALAVYRRCGFVEAGRLPGMVRHRGEEVDEVWMSRPV